MNGQVMDLWGRWMKAALQGTNQMDMFTGWWQRSLQGMSAVSPTYALPWLPSANALNTNHMFNGLQQMWEPLFNLHKMSLQWMGMVPKEKYEALAEHAQALENKAQEQARTIERLQELLSQTGGDNNVVVAQLQDLIGQQSKQFKQLTKSVGEFIQGSSKEISDPK